MMDLVMTGLDMLVLVVMVEKGPPKSTSSNTVIVSSETNDQYDYFIHVSNERLFPNIYFMCL